MADLSDGEYWIVGQGRDGAAKTGPHRFAKPAARIMAFYLSTRHPDCRFWIAREPGGEPYGAVYGAAR